MYAPPLPPHFFPDNHICKHLIANKTDGIFVKNQILHVNLVKFVILRLNFNL